MFLCSLRWVHAFIIIIIIIIISFAFICSLQTSLCSKGRVPPGQGEMVSVWLGAQGELAGWHRGKLLKITGNKYVRSIIIMIIILL